MIELYQYIGKSDRYFTTNNVYKVVDDNITLYTTSKM